MEIKQINIKELKPYSKNNKKHSAEQIKKVANSIREFGWQQPIVCDNEYNIVIGHCRYDAAKSINLTHVPVLFADKLTKTQIKALRLADNKLSEIAEWDFDNIKIELDELKLEGFDIELTGFDMSEFEEEKENEENKDDIYTKKVEVPLYEPKNEKPNINEIYNAEKYKELINNIENSNIEETEKTFLKFAAARHIVFNYEKIADYYANSKKEVQEHFEKSALVIIDFNEAIRSGYVKLSENIKMQYGEENE